MTPREQRAEGVRAFRAIRNGIAAAVPLWLVIGFLAALAVTR